MIVVFGSINVDMVVRVVALPGPGETVLAPDYDVVAGGKGANQAVAAARAGAATRMIGCVGRDGFAETALGEMRDCGIDLSAVIPVDGRTACAMIGVDDGGANQIIVASGANRELRAGQLDDRLLAAIDEHTPGLPEAERAKRLRHARSAHYATLQAKALATRKRKAAERRRSHG